ncbi:MAG: hypothetical protein PHD43_09095 [Methylococcales bacterium]|nr:hypothetical protein [Methylococcales bacterium]
MTFLANIGWQHPVDESDQWDGFNEPGIEHFAGSPIQHLAREVNQNALDAGDTDIVVVKIRLHEVEVSSIPHLAELKANLISCHEASLQESEKARIFFEAAQAELNKHKISVLEISDYNTLGIRGPSENGTPFFAFMKAKGQSRKGNDTATGSYGIGKFAPYAVSKIRTIFISTVYQEDSGVYTQLTQGKSILMSHDRDGKRKQGVGFWGIREKCQPVSGVSPDFPKWIQRTNSKADLPASKGSKLTVLGFDAAKNWQAHLAVSVAENFFGAISDGKLIVVVDDTYTLDQTTIYGFFENDTIRGLIKNLKDEPEQFDNSKNYLAAHIGGIEVITEETEQRELGLCQVKILIGENLPKKVCALRNGMFITDSLNRLKIFSDFKDFVAVFHCQSTKGNELLRSMEPPRHDDFEPARLATKEEKKRGKKALEDLSAWLKEMLKKHAKDPVSEVTVIDELKDFFGDEGDGDGGKGTEEINPYGEVVIRAKPIRTRVKASEKLGDGYESGDGEGGDSGTVASGGDGLVGRTGAVGGNGLGGGNGARSRNGLGGKGDGEGGGSQKVMVDINNVRAILSGTKTRKIAFTPVSSGKIVLHVKEAGADSDYDVAIVKSGQGILGKGGVVLDVQAGTRINIDIELNQEFSGALKVVAHEI